MKPATLIRILPVIGLTSCTAPKAITAGEGSNVPVKPTMNANGPQAPAIGPKPAATSATPVSNPTTPPAEPGKSFFSFLKPASPQSPAIGPKMVSAPKAPATNETPPPGEPKKSFFSFLKPKAPPKALVIGQVPSPNTPRQISGDTAPPLDLPKDPTSDDSGLRLPDMLTMPDKGEFESTNPASKKTGGDPGAVTVRPPTDPPSRPKPKDDKNAKPEE